MFKLIPRVMVIGLFGSLILGCGSTAKPPQNIAKTVSLKNGKQVNSIFMPDSFSGNLPDKAIAATYFQCEEFVMKDDDVLDSYIEEYGDDSTQKKLFAISKVDPERGKKMKRDFVKPKIRKNLAGMEPLKDAVFHMRYQVEVEDYNSEKERVVMRVLGLRDINYWRGRGYGTLFIPGGDIGYIATDVAGRGYEIQLGSYYRNKNDALVVSKTDRRNFQQIEIKGSKSKAYVLLAHDSQEFTMDFYAQNKTCKSWSHGSSEKYYANILEIVKAEIKDDSGKTLVVFE